MKTIFSANQLSSNISGMRKSTHPAPTKKDARKKCGRLKLVGREGFEPTTKRL